MKRILVTGVLVMVVAGVASAYRAIREAVVPNISVYVDNGSAEQMTVIIDGEEVEQVPAGTVKIVECFAGDRRIQVRRAGQIVFDEVKTLEKPFGKRPTKYLLNPEKRNRYWRYRVQYGAGLPKFVRTYGYGLDSKYQALANSVDLVVVQAWMKVNSEYVVSEKPPRTIKSRMGMASVSVLARMSKSDYERIESARDRFDVSQSEYDRFHSFVKRLMESTKPI